MSLIFKRKSVRKFRDEKVSDEKIENLLKAAMQAPSSCNSQPWEFIVVEDKDTLQKLSDCRAGGVKMLREAACAIVVVGDKEASDVWIEDCSAVMSNMHLMAHYLGLGSCWVQGRLRKAEDGRDTEAFVREILGYPEQYGLQAILTIGVPNEEKEGYALDQLPMEKIHRETF